MIAEHTTSVTPTAATRDIISITISARLGVEAVPMVGCRSHRAHDIATISATRATATVGTITTEVAIHARAMVVRAVTEISGLSLNETRTTSVEAAIVAIILHFAMATETNLSARFLQ